jgi:hypothetical protein
MLARQQSCCDRGIPIPRFFFDADAFRDAIAQERNSSNTWIRRALFWCLGPCHNGLHDEQSENEAKGLFHVDISILTLA